MPRPNVLERDRARHRRHLGRRPRSLVRRHPTEDSGLHSGGVGGGVTLMHCTNIPDRRAHGIAHARPDADSCCAPDTRLDASRPSHRERARWTQSPAAWPRPASIPTRCSGSTGAGVHRRPLRRPPNGQISGLGESCSAGSASTMGGSSAMRAPTASTRSAARCSIRGTPRSATSARRCAPVAARLSSRRSSAAQSSLSSPPISRDGGDAA